MPVWMMRPAVLIQKDDLPVRRRRAPAAQATCRGETSAFIDIDIAESCLISLGAILEFFFFSPMKTTETTIPVINLPKPLIVQNTASISEIWQLVKEVTAKVIGKTSTAPLRHVLRGGEPQAGAERLKSV